MESISTFKQIYCPLAKMLDSPHLDLAHLKQKLSKRVGSVSLIPPCRSYQEKLDVFTQFELDWGRYTSYSYPSLVNLEMIPYLEIICRRDKDKLDLWGDMNGRKTRRNNLSPHLEIDYFDFIVNEYMAAN